MEAFDADVQLLPQWVQYWMNFMGAVIIVSTLSYMFRRDTRLLSLYLLVTTVLMVFAMTWMHGQMGMVRLLGIVHIVFWVPLIFYLWGRLQNNPPGRVLTIVTWVLFVTLSISLIFDFYDVFRWIAGERAPIVSATLSWNQLRFATFEHLQL